MSKRLWPATPSRTLRDALGRERVVEDALVVRVGVLLGVPGRERPAVDLGVDPLHREVRALHERAP